MMNCNQPVFRKEWYRQVLKQGPKSFFNSLSLDIKWSKQRVQRGFSDYDEGDIIDEYFKNHKELELSLEDYHNWNTNVASEERLQGITSKIDKEWQSILDRMIYLFKEMDEDECSYENKNDLELLKNITIKCKRKHLNCLVNMLDIYGIKR